MIGRSYLFGDVIHYSCEEGYKLQGSKSRQCNEHGIWTGTRPTCKGKEISDSKLLMKLKLLSTYLRRLKEHA